MSQNLRIQSKALLTEKVCRLRLQIFRHFFCDFKGKPMPINIGLKAKQAPNHRDAEMDSRMKICTISITQAKTHAGGITFQPVVTRQNRLSAGQEINTQSRTILGIDRYG